MAVGKSRIVVHRAAEHYRGYRLQTHWFCGAFYPIRCSRFWRGGDCNGVSAVLDSPTSVEAQGAPPGCIISEV